MELVIAAAHPTEAFGSDTEGLLSATAGEGALAVCPALSSSSSSTMEAMVDELDAERLRRGLPPWIFWGMSGGGWLALLYARRHRDGLLGIVVESACACFRDRLADPACALSPYYPAWRPALEARGLIDGRAHASPVSARDARWIDVEGVGQVFRLPDGPALLVSPMPIEGGMRERMAMLWDFDARPWIAALAIPALVLAGSADPVVPVAKVRAVHEAIAGSQLVVVEGGGHVPTGERRPEVAAAFRAWHPH